MFLFNYFLKLIESLFRLGSFDAFGQVAQLTLRIVVLVLDVRIGILLLFVIFVFEVIVLKSEWKYIPPRHLKCLPS